MTRELAKSILDLFLFEDICNNHNFHEDTHAITWVGDHFAVMERSTGEIQKFKMQLVESDLPEQEWRKAYDEQEWFE